MLNVILALCGGLCLVAIILLITSFANSKGPREHENGEL